MQIGPYSVAVPLALAPMAGITDKPFRQLCRRLGAGWAVSEMITSDPSLQHTKKTRSRADHRGETGVIAVQIAGSDPHQLAAAAQYNVARGAQVIDINMGCPAKKVCHVQAGSALLQNEALVADILHTVVRAVSVPVTLKTRLGWHDEHKNIATVARLAEEAGIAALAVHGRTRTQMYQGQASYDLITEIKHTLRIPLWVNGDLTSPQQAMRVWRQTAADGVMIGRGAQGQPWLFRDLAHYRVHGRLPEALSVAEHAAIVCEHIAAMHAFYGEHTGVRVARKHIGWYVAALPGGEAFRRGLNQLDNAAAQSDALARYLDTQVQTLSAWPCAYRSAEPAAGHAEEIS